MFKIGPTILISVFYCLLSGCEELGAKGAAITSTVAKTGSKHVSMVTIYGYSGSDEKVAFAIFSNIQTENAISTVSGSWVGQIRTEENNEKPVLVFRGSPQRIEINGTSYSYMNGRAFFALYSNGELTVHQLDLPILDANRKEAIAELTEQETIQAFLRK